LRPPEHARLQARGKSLGGRITVDSSFDLAPDGAGTLMRWTAEVHATGVLSPVGS
jgi:carbon monoxide dehydrogenase subunit G